MAKFRYTAITSAGQRVQGVLAGASEQAVLADLEARRLTPVLVEARDGEGRRPRAVSARRLGAAYRQVSELLHAGVPLLRALRLLGNRRSDPRLGAVFKDLARAVSEGEDLAGAMSAHPETFPPVHVAMVRAGEKGGFLDAVLGRLGQLVLRQAEMRAALTAGLIYPAVLVSVGALILAGIFTFLVPRFRTTFAKLEATEGLPALTNAVFFVSDAFSRHGLLTAFVLAGAAIALRFALRRDDVRRALDTARTRAPVIGPLTRNLAAARFCRMLGTMLSAGVPMLGAMQIAREAAGNRAMERAILHASEAVRAGQSLHEPLAQSGLFDDDVIEVISVGEAANNLDSVLLGIADTIEQRIDRQITAAVRLVEPLLILIIALVVAMVAAGLLLPLLAMSGQV
jgi:general secretion pathway protein F/type IV pilus assembly protein PilC